MLDDAAYNGDAAATATGTGTGTVTYASPALTWTGNLNPGDTATVKFSVTVNNPDTDNHLLASTVTSASAGSNCPVGGSDPRCASTVTVSQLTIVSTANTSTVTPGGVVVYTTTLTNAGQTPYTGISVSFGGTPGDATSNGDQTASSGTLSVGTTGAVWTGDIPVGGIVTLTGSVTVADPYPGGPVMALLLVSAAPGSNCPAGSTDPRCAPAVDVLIPGLSITQSADTAAAVPGQVIGYTLTITNTGTAPYAGAVVTESFAEMFDDAAYGGNAFANSGAVTYASPVLTWTGDLAPAASAVITFTVTVNNPDTGDKLVITTAASAAAGSSCPPGTTSGGCQLTVAVLTPGLTIVKTASTTTPVPGQQVTYTITVTDTGQTSYTGASLTDPLAAVLDDATYDSDAPAAATAGTVSYAGSTVSWTGDLNPGDTAAITYSVTIDNPDNGDLVLANTVTSATPGSNCAATSTDPRCTMTVTVVSAATLTITATAGAPSAVAGGKVTYTVTIANSGVSAYAGAAFTVPLSGVLDDAAYNNNAAAVLTGIGTIAGTVSFDGSTLSWAGDVPAAGSVTLTYSVTVNSPDTTGNQILASTVTSASTGSNCGSGSADPRCTTTVTVSALAIDAAFSPADRHARRDGGRDDHDHQYRADPVLRDQRHLHQREHPRPADQRGQPGGQLRHLVGRHYRGGVDRGRPGRRDGDDHRLADRR